MDIGYVRIRTKNKTVEQQITELKEAGCALIYVENDSAQKFSNGLIKNPQRAREQFSLCLDRLKTHDKLVVSEMRQLELPIRGVVHLINRLKSAGIYFASWDDYIDTSEQSHELATHLSAVFENLDNTLASERSSRAIEIAKHKGRLTGRPLKAIPAGIEIARVLINSGVSVRDAAKQTLISQSTLYRRVGAKS